ncbi:MAG: glycosyltransferase, partial [Planctomycetales bacterium]|nr:glycosyltransferase [Planctomycetales bacterium]
MSQPLVTIGLTTYNSADSVERAVASALAQTWRPIEIVAVDDCSSDATVVILNKLATHYSELRVFVNPTNRGVAVSRNRILDEARGDFIAFFDDDDESLPQRIESQVCRIVSYESDFANGAPVVCHSARMRIYAEGVER